MTWQTDKQTRSWQTKFALLWLGLTLFVIWWFYNQTMSLSESELVYIDRRLGIVQKIVMISGVSFSIVFLALMGLAGSLFHRKRR